MQLPEMFGVGNFENNPYLLLNATFGKWWILVLYLIWFAAIYMHLTHGFWSMFQTVGWNGKTWFKRVKVIGVVVATLIIILFVSAGINAFLQANGLISC
jgi:succinate dehydrogenase / fumarate reductase cytochrome b subunit